MVGFVIGCFVEGEGVAQDALDDESDELTARGVSSILEGDC